MMTSTPDKLRAPKGVIPKYLQRNSVKPGRKARKFNRLPSPEPEALPTPDEFSSIGVSQQESQTHSIDRDPYPTSSPTSSFRTRRSAVDDLLYDWPDNYAEESAKSTRVSMSMLWSTPRFASTSSTPSSPRPQTQTTEYMRGITIHKMPLHHIKDRDNHPRFNQEYKHKEMAVTELPAMFDKLVSPATLFYPFALTGTQPHDYQAGKIDMSAILCLDWIDGPGLRPWDIRARTFRTHLNPPADDFPDTHVLFRGRYTCTGLCQEVPESTTEQMRAGSPQAELLNVGRHIQGDRIAAKRFKGSAKEDERDEDSGEDAEAHDGSDSDEEEDQVEDGDDGTSQSFASPKQNIPHNCKASILVGAQDAVAI